MTYWLLLHTVLLYDTCWYDIPYHDIMPVVVTYYAMTYYLWKNSMLQHTASCSKIICYDIVCCCAITHDIVHAVSWHVTSYAVTKQVSVVAKYHDMMHCMLLSYNIWHSACCDISSYDIVTVCCCNIPSIVMWHMFLDHLKKYNVSTFYYFFVS
jgi:hypothetical protein